MKPPILVIACDELPERKQKCVEHLAEIGIEATFLRGVHGNTWGLETIHQYEDGYRISPGHVALDINHYMAWQCLSLLLAKDDDYGIIFEDDVVLQKDFYEATEGVVEELKEKLPNWELVFLGSGDAGMRTWNKVTERIGGPTSRFCRQENPWGTHALMIRRRAIPTLLKRMAIAERNMDQQLYLRVLKENYVRWCMVLPSMVQQRTYDHTGGGKPEWLPSTLDKVTQERIEAEVRPATVSPELYTKSLALMDRNPCLYRGEFIEGMAETITDAGNTKYVVAMECARLNGFCHNTTHKTDVLVHDGQAQVKAYSCETCRIRLEPQKNENITRLPIPDGHFNPTMIEYDGRLILITRDSWGHSALGFWELRNPDLYSDNWEAIPLTSLRTRHPEMTRLEDPRAFMAYDENGKLKLHASVSLPDRYPPKLVRTGYVRFSEDLSRIEYSHVFDSPYGNAYEKNWVCFLDEKNRMRWIYGSKPYHVILDENGDELTKTPNRLPWRGGALRGGATPVYHNGRFIHFAHGCLKVTRGNVYTLACTEFAATWPYNIIRQAPIPLLWPDDAGVRTVVKRNVLFPGGAIMTENDWLICLGIDDTYCGIVRIPYSTVEAAMTDTPELEQTVTIRNTPIALGVKLMEKK